MTGDGVESPTDTDERDQVDREIASDIHVTRGSERGARRICRTMWDFGYRQGWTPIVGEQPLEFGTAIHSGFEAVYDPAFWDSTTPEEKLERAISAFTKVGNEQRDRYLLATSQTRVTWDGQDDYRDRIILGTQMLKHYVLDIHPREDVGLRPVKVELKFRVPVLDANGEPVRCYDSPNCGQIHSHGAPVMHDGRIDCLMQDIANGGYWVLDWKTAAKFYTTSEFAWLHDQLRTYLAVLRHVLKIDMRGFILAEIKKDFPKPPALLKRKSNGGIYSQNSQQGTTYDLFERTVTEGDMNGYRNGAYDDFLLFLAGPDAPKFHQRFKVEESANELAITWANVALEVADMVEPNQRIYPSQSQMNCKRCRFRSPCEMKMRGMNYEYTLNSGFERKLLDLSVVESNGDSDNDNAE